MTTRQLFLCLGKENHKFSSSHMTVFADGSKERLHGHNYQVEVKLGISDLTENDMIDLNGVKKLISGRCQLWDERVLLAVQNPHFKNSKRVAENLEFTLCGKKYSLPCDEVVELPLMNITVESLSRILTEGLWADLKRDFEWPSGMSAPARIQSLRVRVLETRGQGAEYFIS